MVLAYQGRRFPLEGDLMPYKVDDIITYANGLLGKLGMSYNTWLNNGYLVSRIEAELLDKKRQKVWLTSCKETACSYALRSPEIVWHILMDAIDNILWKRRWRQSNTMRLLKARNDLIIDTLEGSPFLVIINLPECGHNHPFDNISANLVKGIEQINIRI